MPIKAISSTSTRISDHFTYYDAPTTDLRFNTVFGSGSAVSYPSYSSNMKLSLYKGGTLFYLKVVNTNGTKGTVSITYPWSQSTNVTNGYVGGSKQCLVSIYSYITISVSVNYGYSFKGWYTAATGGTLINSTQNQQVPYTHAYRDFVWYAQYN